MEDATPWIETKEPNQAAYLKKEPKDILAAWALQCQQHTTPEEHLIQLIRFCKIARKKKMTVFAESMIKLQPLHEAELAKICELPLTIMYRDLMLLIKSPDVSLVLEAFELIEASAATEPINQFEYTYALEFIKCSMLTTFPDYRQKFMKCVLSFLNRLRTAHDKELKKPTLAASCQPLVKFLGDVIDHCQQNLYLDKPIEGAFPLFDVLKSIQELFGGIEHHVNKSKIFEPVNLLARCHLLESKGLFNFLVNSLKSSWANVRANAFDLLDRYSEEYAVFKDPHFVNDLLIPTAFQFANDPRAMMAEGCSLMLKLAFTKCIDTVHLDGKALTGSHYEKRLQFAQYVLNQIKFRLLTFQQSLITQGKTSDLIHGLLAFFKNLFADFKIVRAKLNDSDFKSWREFFHDLLATCLDISRACAGLLSNNRLTEEGEDLVDSRGHPIVQSQNVESMLASGDKQFEDYENLILVGIWLAVKENGETLKNLLKWADLPKDANDDTTFLVAADIDSLTQNFLEMMFQFKHRGAICITAETFELFVSRLLVNPTFQHMPRQMLDKTLEKITTESHSTVLRRSAGIPPIIIAILRAEPSIIKANRSWNKKKGVEKRTEKTELLDTTLAFLLDLAKNATFADSKIHALNIMKFIFSDTILREDITQFIPTAMMLSCDEFESDNWSIRNSALMCFTALIKRLLDTHHIQDQDLSKKRGFTFVDLWQKFPELLTYFQGKLSVKSGIKGEHKERQDMTVFSVMLMLSRLIPYSFAGQEYRQEFTDLKEFQDSVLELCQLIRLQSSNSTYFVRKICAQSLLPLLKFDDWLGEVRQCFETLKTQQLKQNEVHGLIIRVNIFLEAFFRYKSIAVENRSKEEWAKLDALVLGELISFQQHLPKWDKISRITWALFTKTQRQTLKRVSTDAHTISTAQNFYKSQLNELMAVPLLTPDQQKYLVEVLRINLDFSGRDVFGLLELVLTKLRDYNDLASQFLKAFIKKVSKMEPEQLVNCCRLTQQVLSGYLALEKNGIMAWNKIFEGAIKILFKAWKYVLATNFEWPDHADFRKSVIECMDKLLSNFAENATFKAYAIKIQTLAVRYFVRDADSFEGTENQVSKVAGLLLEHVYMSHKERVREVSAKCLASLIPLMAFKDLSKNLFFQSAQNYESYLKLMQAFVLILNDENPEIRLFMINQNLGTLLNFEVTIQSVKGVTLRDTNDQLVVNTLFQTLCQQALTYVEADPDTALTIAPQRTDYFEQNLPIPSPYPGRDFVLTKYQVMFLFVDTFLNRFIVDSPYREHLALNFDDKIFFHEPVNKFYDLPCLRRCAWEHLQLVKHLHCPYSNKNQKKQEAFENEVIGELSRLYSTDAALKLNAQGFEQIMGKIMEAATGKSTEAFRKSLRENSNIDHILKQFV